MPILAKDIENFCPKILRKKQRENQSDWDNGFVEGSNMSREIIGKNSLGLNREKLAKILWESNQHRLYGKDGLTWEKGIELDHGGMETKYYFDLAQSIIAHEGELLEVKKQNQCTCNESAILCPIHGSDG